jgi:hypothetical protein
LTGTLGTIYVNGQVAVLDSSVPALTSILRDRCRFGTDGTYIAKAAIDEIKFYNRALTAAEVMTDFSANGTVI